MMNEGICLIRPNSGIECRRSWPKEDEPDYKEGDHGKRRADDQHISHGRPGFCLTGLTRTFDDRVWVGIVRHGQLRLVRCQRGAIGTVPSGCALLRCSKRNRA